MGMLFLYKAIEIHVKWELFDHFKARLFKRKAIISSDDRENYAFYAPLLLMRKTQNYRVFGIRARNLL